VSLPRFCNPLKLFSGLKKVTGKGKFQDGRQLQLGGENIIA